jgi:uncharacterized protein
MLEIITAQPSELELKPSPIPTEWIIDGDPQARASDVARSRNGAMNVVVWSCTRGRFEWHYNVDEMVHILSGEVHITDHAGRQRRLGPGDTAFFPAGSSSVWCVTQNLRKVAVTQVPVPRVLCMAMRVWNKALRIIAPAPTASLTGAVASPQ